MRSVTASILSDAVPGFKNVHTEAQRSQGTERRIVTNINHH